MRCRDIVHVDVLVPARDTPVTSMADMYKYKILVTILKRKSVQQVFRPCTSINQGHQQAERETFHVSVTTNPSYCDRPTQYIVFHIVDHICVLYNPSVSSGYFFSNGVCGTKQWQHRPLFARLGPVQPPRNGSEGSISVSRQPRWLIL